MKQHAIDALRLRIQEICENAHIRPETAFIVWYLTYACDENHEMALKAICDGTRDKGIDAIFTDPDAGKITIIQSKYRERGIGTRENTADFMKLLFAVKQLVGNRKEYQSLLDGISSDAERLVKQARRHISRDKWNLEVVFLTTGRVGKISDIEDEFFKLSERQDVEITPNVVDLTKIPAIVDDWKVAASPPIPTVYLKVETTSGQFHRYDKALQVDSIIAAINGAEIAKLYHKYEDRIFARNIRLGLGNTQINKEISKSVKKEPEKFFYLNNGVTIICDFAKFESESGKHLLKLQGAQIINGQQTTRTLAQNSDQAKNVTVLVRVMRVDRTRKQGMRNEYETFVSRIVRGANTQNPISVADLMSNHHMQVHIERELRKRGYLYLRKRQTQREAKQRWSGTYRPVDVMKKEHLAQFLGAACASIDPYIIRTKGRKGLFEDDYYDKLFSSYDPSFYIAHIHLGRLLERLARKKKFHRWDSRWVTLFVFAQRNRHLFTRGKARVSLITALEENDLCVVTSLERIYKEIFRAANRSYIDEKHKMTGRRKSRNDYFGRTNIAHSVTKRLNKRLLLKLENSLLGALDDFRDDKDRLKTAA